MKARSANAGSSGVIIQNRSEKVFYFFNYIIVTLIMLT